MPYPQFTLSYEAAISQIEETRGSVEAIKVKTLIEGL